MFSKDDITYSVAKPSLANVSMNMINPIQALNRTEKLALQYIFSFIDLNDIDSKTITFQAKDLAETLGFTGESFFKQVEITLDQLQSNYLTILEKNIVRKISLIQSVMYIKGEAQIVVKLSDDLIPFLKRLKTEQLKTSNKNEPPSQ